MKWRRNQTYIYIKNGSLGEQVNHSIIDKKCVAKKGSQFGVRDNEHSFKHMEFDVRMKTISHEYTIYLDFQQGNWSQHIIFRKNVIIEFVKIDYGVMELLQGKGNKLFTDNFGRQNERGKLIKGRNQKSNSKYKKV